MGWVITYLVGLYISYAIMQKIYRIGLKNGVAGGDGMGLAIMLLLWPIMMPIMFLVSLPGIISSVFGEE